MNDPLKIKEADVKDMRIRELVIDYSESRRSLDEVVAKIKECLFELIENIE